jgi:hypothetical protein
LSRRSQNAGGSWEINGNGIRHFGLTWKINGGKQYTGWASTLPFPVLTGTRMEAEVVIFAMKKGPETFI